MEEGVTWVQKVSSTPATRLDVINLQVLTNAIVRACEVGIVKVERGDTGVRELGSTLTSAQEQLDQRLETRQARETGICPVRRDLYDQTFGTHYIHL